MMGKSYVIRMPELAELDIPEKQRTIFVKDTTIFEGLLNAHRSLAHRESGAVRGDYVLVEVHGTGGHSQVLHIELGGRRFPELEKLLLGATAGQELQTTVWGQEMRICVRTVRCVVDIPLTDESVAALNMPGITSLTDYRKNYLQEHGEQIALRLFGKLQNKLMDQIREKAVLHLEPGEPEYYHRQQREMIQNMTGDVDQRLLSAYGPVGGTDAQECDRLFFEDNRKMFAFYVWARDFAGKNGVVPSEEDQKKAVDNFCMLFDKTQEQIQREGLLDDALRSFYFQYGIGQLRAYFLSVVRFSATDVPSFPDIGVSLTQK